MADCIEVLELEIWEVIKIKRETSDWAVQCFVGVNTNNIGVKILKHDFGGET